MALPRWTDERTEKLFNLVDGADSPISQDVVASAAEELETSSRSVASKLRREGFEVQSAQAARSKKFTDAEEAELAELVRSNSGELTYAQIAERFAGGKFSAKSVQGKLLSMELHEHVAPAPEKTVELKYSEEEEAQILSLWESGEYIEDIASALNRSVSSIRGKCLSMRSRLPGVDLPVQKNKVQRTDILEGVDVPNMSIEEIAEEIERTPRGVKTMLTRRGLTAKDYDGAAKKAKNAEANA